MSDEREIRIEPPDPDEVIGAAASAPAAAADEPKPLVVIEYRSRHLPAALLVPLLILLLAAIVIGIRIRAADWPGLAILQQPTPVVVHEPVEPPQIRASVLPAPPPEILVAEAPPKPTPAPDPPAPLADQKVEPTKADAVAESESHPQAPAEAPKPPAPAAFEGPLPVGFDPPVANEPLPPPRPAEEPVAQAEPPRPPRPREQEKEVTKEQVWNDITREAAEAQAQRKELEQMAPKWLEQDRQEAERRQAEHDAETKRRTEDDRSRFRIELQQVLARRGLQAADEIYELCERFGRETVPEVEEMARQILERNKARVSRKDLLRMLRTCGLPETRILDYLAHSEKKNILARNGPRNEDEAMVRAAKALLAVPLPPRTAPKPAQAASGNANASPNANANGIPSTNTSTTTRGIPVRPAAPGTAARVP